MLQNSIILFLISASGVLLYTRKHIPHRLLHLLIALGAGAMLSVSLIHILPESLGETPWAIYAFLLGFLSVYLIEEILSPHSNDHTHGDHVHEDPHEHYEHVALISFLAIAFHTFFDGVSIRAGFSISETAGYIILLSVCIHQIPVSLSLSALLQNSEYTRRSQILLMLAFACSAPLGYVSSDVFLSQASHLLTGLAMAFAGGSLLYVATTELLPILHERRYQKYATIFSFLFGVLVITLLKIFAE